MYLVVLYIIVVSSEVMFNFLVTTFSLSIGLKVKSRK